VHEFLTSKRGDEETGGTERKVGNRIETICPSITISGTGNDSKEVLQENL
jgi:hypothetical protein